MKDIKLIYAEPADGGGRLTLYKQRGRIYDTSGIAPALTTESDKNAHIIVEDDDNLIKDDE